MRDGNLICHLNWYEANLYNDNVRLVLPQLDQIDPECLAELKAHCPTIWAKHIPANYTGGPADQRRQFWRSNPSIACQTVLATSIGDAGRSFRGKLINYHMHVSTQFGIAQPIDGLMHGEVEMLRKCIKGWVHDEGQLAWLNVAFAELVEKALVAVEPYHRLMAMHHIDRFRLGDINLTDAQLDADVLVLGRMSDPEYGYDAIEHLLKPSQTVLFTDTNGYMQTRFGQAMPANYLFGNFSRAEYYELLERAKYVLYRPNRRILHLAKLELYLLRPYDVELQSHL